jgi:hypothetical protein
MQILQAPRDFQSLQFMMMPTWELAWRGSNQLGSRSLPRTNPGMVLISAKTTWADSTQSAHWPLGLGFARILPANNAHWAVSAGCDGS